MEAGQRWDDGDSRRWVFRLAGRLLLHAGEVREGLALLDEAMLGSPRGEVSPILTGEIFCSLIEACQEIGDYRRIGDWTRALTRWCEAQPDLVPFTAQCAVHRAQLLQLQGDYAEALSELAFASERYAAKGQPVTGMARYELGEVLRVQGDYAGAEAAYEEARRRVTRPQPGCPCSGWLAGERPRRSLVAATARREPATPSPAPACCPPRSTSCSAADEVEEARAAAVELEEIAERFACAAVSARAAYASGSGRCWADGAAAEALASLRRAWKTWIDLGARYEAAHTRVQMALALRALGDEDSAASELGVAERTFAEIGARPPRRRPVGSRDRALPAGLTAREVEVLRLVAAGHSNPQIAAALFLSHKTVQRHLSNIFAKTGVTSRTAAAAYAFEHQLA